MTDYVDDRIAYPHLVGLRDAILPEMDARGLPGLCEALVGAGAEVAFDFCSTECEGMGWTRLVNAYAASNFPNPDALPNRGLLLMAETFEIGLVRGMELPDNPADGMDVEVLQGAAQLQLADMSALLAVICAYFGGLGIPFVIGTYTPYGPLGPAWGLLAGHRIDRICAHGEGLMATVTVRVDYAAIQGMFENSGEIGRFGQRVNRVAVGRARAIVSKDTGLLAASITAAPNAGSLQYHMTLFSLRRYADWVNHGTTGPILPTRSTWLSVFKRNPTGKYGKVVRVFPPKGVRGQKAQYFLESGLEQALAGTGIIVGIRR